MRIARVGLVAWLGLASVRIAVAQSAAPEVLFADVSMKFDHDRTDGFSGSVGGLSGGGATGMRLSDRHSLRFEVDIPSWRSSTITYSTVWCAPGACASGTGQIPASARDREAVRTVSYGFLYAYHLPATGRVRLAFVVGGGAESAERRSSGTLDELSADGTVLAHREYSAERSNVVPAAIVGLDAEIRLTSHLALAPQIRFHTFPYPHVAIVRPGVALRWRF